MAVCFKTEVPLAVYMYLIPRCCLYETTTGLACISIPYRFTCNFYTRDRKRKRYVRDGGKEGVKKVKTESGSWISSTYKSGRYKKWKTGNRQEGMLGGEEHEEGVVNRKRGVSRSYE